MKELCVGHLVPYREEITRVSYDFTNIPCPMRECGYNLQRILDIPGDTVGRPGRRVQTLRCLNCLFEEDLSVRFSEEGEPLEVVGEAPGWCLHRLPEIPDLTVAVGMEWTSKEVDLEKFSDWTFFGGEPIWLQGGVASLPCPGCDQPMRFVLQLASKTLDPFFLPDGTPSGDGARWQNELGVDFRMKIENWSTLYQFECEACRITTSLTEST